MNLHSPLRRVFCTAIIGLCAGLVGGCVEGGTTTPIASVSSASGDAYIRRATGGQVLAKGGEALFSRDGFWTGAGTMHISAAAGGEIEVYPNTDPIIQKSICFAISFFHKGKLHVVGSGMCVNGDYQASNVGYEYIAPGVRRVWVLEGQVRVMTPPFGVIRTGQRADLVNGQLTNLTTFSPADFAKQFPPIQGSRIPPQRFRDFRPRRQVPAPPPPEGPVVG